MIGFNACFSESFVCKKGQEHFLCIDCHLCFGFLTSACKLAGPPHTVPKTSFSVLRAASSGSSLPAVTTFFTARITLAGPSVYWLSQARASSNAPVPSEDDNVSSESPRRKAVSGSTLAAPPSSRRAAPLPTTRTSRAAPPQPGTRPMCLWTNRISLPGVINLSMKNKHAEGQSVHRRPYSARPHSIFYFLLPSASKGWYNLTAGWLQPELEHLNFCIASCLSCSFWPFSKEDT